MPIPFCHGYANEQSSGFEVAGNVRNGNGIPICDRLILKWYTGHSDVRYGKAGGVAVDYG